MDARVFDCPNCNAHLDALLINTGEATPCPSCGRLVGVNVFPAFYQTSTQDSRPAVIVEDTQAGCFYHPDKQAVVPCSACGRFLCALCDVAIGEKSLCPSCLHTGQQTGKWLELENKRTLFDSIAFSLAFLPLLLFPLWLLTFITAPLAIGVGFYALRKPGSLVRRATLRAWAAIIIGILELGGWGFFLLMTFGKRI